MIRPLVGYAAPAVIGIIALKLILGVLGFAFKLMWGFLWLAALGFIFYLVLKIISPSTAKRVKEKIRGDEAV